jgi:ParB family chromosome partitioning protein
MGSRVAGKIKLQSVDELLGVPEIAGTQEIELGRIHSFPNHPFKVLDDEKMDTLVESIRENGILNPVIVRPDQNGDYEMISGHRRKLACSLAGLEAMPVIIRDMTDDEAVIAMVSANRQREEVLPSEKAAAYKMWLDAMNRQGKRSDLTLSPLDTKLDSGEKIAQETGESRPQIFRYIRLNELIPDILEMVDNAVIDDKTKPQMAFRPAVELSYLTKEQQSDLLLTMQSEDRTPSLSQALLMKELSGKDELDMDKIFNIMRQEKPNQVEQFKMPKEKINRFFPPGTSAQKIEDTIIKALELYRKRERSRDMER